MATSQNCVFTPNGGGLVREISYRLVKFLDLVWSIPIHPHRWSHQPFVGQREPWSAAVPSAQCHGGPTRGRAIFFWFMAICHGNFLNEKRRFGNLEIHWLYDFVFRWFHCVWIILRVDFLLFDTFYSNGRISKKAGFRPLRKDVTGRQPIILMTRYAAERGGEVGLLFRQFSVSPSVVVYPIGWLGCLFCQNLFPQMCSPCFLFPRYYIYLNHWKSSIVFWMKKYWSPASSKWPLGLPKRWSPTTP